MNYMGITFIGVSIPVFTVLIIATVSRKLTMGRSNKLFLSVLWLSLICAGADFFCNVANRGGMMSPFLVRLVVLLDYIYFFSRNAVNMLFVFYIISVTRTWFRIRGIFRKIPLILPYLGVCALLFINTQNHRVFTVTAEEGYQRGEWILYIYAFAFMYLILGVYLLITRRKMLRLSEWLSLFSIYFLNIVGVVIQFVWENLLVESYFTAITLLFVVLYVQKPEIQVDLNTGLPGFFAFRDEIKKIRISGQRVQVVIASIVNAAELRRFLGEKDFFAYIHEAERAINTYGKAEKLPYEFYYEDPGYFYIILGSVEFNPVQAVSAIRDMIRKNNPLSDSGIRVELKTVTVRFPEEIADDAELIAFGHNFTAFSGSKIFYHADAILSKREYQIRMKLDEILVRGMNEDRIRVLYRPVLSESDRSVIYAETIARIDDPEFGEIDEKLLESLSGGGGAFMGYEEHVLEQVFSYAGGGGMAGDGFPYVAVRLSANLCMLRNLTDLIWNLRSRNNVHPEQICFIFTESAFDSMDDTYDDNMEKLSLQGYRVISDENSSGSKKRRRKIEKDPDNG
ncbi:MAG: EAL domain-containing protein [Lachnospiraceae bacterium]|nr:EAL domain-containing protein [Lachnospiraceae bacterium]